MSEPFIGEIKAVGFNFAPRSWATCDGQLLSISQNTALFSLLGTNYGGNGQTTFGLPNLKGATPMFWGQGPGLSNYSIGETTGISNVTITSSTYPVHTHTLVADSNTGTATTPANNLLGAPDINVRLAQNAKVYSTAGPNSSMVSGALGASAGGGGAHNNLMPYQVVLYIICLFGVFPARN